MQPRQKLYELVKRECSAGAGTAGVQRHASAAWGRVRSGATASPRRTWRFGWSEQDPATEYLHRSDHVADQQARFAAAVPSWRMAA